MKKEIVIAIIFGLAVGLIITIGMYRARQAMEAIPIQEGGILDAISSTPVASPSVETDLSVQIRIREPQPDAYVTDKNISFSGTTLPSSTIVILQNETEVVGSSDAQGNFSIPITLLSGANICVVRVLPTQGTPIEITRSIVYEPGVQNATPSATTK